MKNNMKQRKPAWFGRNICPLIIGNFWISATSLLGQAANPFQEHVRPTEPLAPNEEAKSFELPDGFRVQVFAAEPDIAKPMNLAFDADGRLWVTETREYPHPAPNDRRGRDAIKVLEDTDGDGRADKITTFADGLNIPIGIYPYPGGVIAWSIPHIWHLEDTDGDGTADRREVLYGPLGYEKDTHGLNSSFTRGFDGWLYATHGFRNDSIIRGSDGSEITLNSGNTYRVRLDGSGVEQYTWGQVNPFGMTQDSLGNLYTADCHSSPVYQLLRGGHYPSFGKPHDGLGFAPVMIQHSHDSTALSGIAYYSGKDWPKEFHDNVFIGNVMTSRVNRDAVQFQGATPTAKIRPDFVKTKDPWFRPVNLQFGPDGALYIADFYNRIIGHYEVPLNHPGRDRERGRIWRISYTGKKGSANLSGAKGPQYSIPRSVNQLLKDLGHPRLARRLLAMNRLTDEFGKEGIPFLETALDSDEANVWQKVHGLWVLFRFDSLTLERLSQAAGDPDFQVRTHAQKILSEWPDWTPQHRTLAATALTDADAHVRKAAADALGRNPDDANIDALMKLWRETSPKDTHLTHTVRMALRNQFSHDGVLQKWAQLNPGVEDRRRVADLLVSVASPESAAWLLKHMQTIPESAENLGRYLRHAARHIPGELTDELATYAEKRFAKNVEGQWQLYQAVQAGTAERDQELTAGMEAWGVRLAGQLLASVESAQAGWYNTPVEGMAVATNPWFLQYRASVDGDQKSWFLSSLPQQGERLTGILRSSPFVLPEEFKFFLAGHHGFPKQPAHKKNLVRLRDAETHQILQTAHPPRQDLAKEVSWDLSAHTGKKGYLEVLDGDSGKAFAWLAIGRFSPDTLDLPVMNPNQVALRQAAAARLIRELEVASLKEKVEILLKSPQTEPAVRAEAARTLGAFDVPELAVAMIPLIGDPAVPFAQQRKIAEVLISQSELVAQGLIADALSSVPYAVQVKLARSLASSLNGSEILLGLIGQGKAPAHLLRDGLVREKLDALEQENLAALIAELTQGLEPLSDVLQNLIQEKRTGYSAASARPEAGAQLFVQACAVCHQVNGEGGLIGPQLDGIGNRGLQRLLEDILDPNRNVDHAFRFHMITLKNGDIVSGLPRREEGEVLVVADATGQEVRIPKKDIIEKRETERSLMPEDFGQIIPPADFNHLMSYLLSLSAPASQVEKQE